MLRISKLTDYAALIMGFLARDPQQVFSASAIAEAVYLPAPTVSKILKMLSAGKLVISQRGTAGGYRLARVAQEITMAELIAAMEGQPAITECCDSTNTCMLDSLCAIKENWQAINKMITAALSKLTLNDMIRPLSGQSLTLRGIPIKVQGAA